MTEKERFFAGLLSHLGDGLQHAMKLCSHNLNGAFSQARRLTGKPNIPADHFIIPIF